MGPVERDGGIPLSFYRRVSEWVWSVFTVRK